MRKNNKTSQSHSSSESEVLLLDAGLLKDGLLALDFWDVVMEVLRSSKITESPTHAAARKCSRNKTSSPKQMENRDVEQLSHKNRVTTNAIFSRRVYQLYISEDDEDVIKIIINSRSPTMRHVSRNHRVALDWLFDRFKLKLDPKIPIKYVDTRTNSRTC